MSSRLRSVSNRPRMQRAPPARTCRRSTPRTSILGQPMSPEPAARPGSCRSPHRRRRRLPTRRRPTTTRRSPLVVTTPNSTDPSASRPADSVSPEEVDIVTISPSTVISSMESPPMSAARTDVVVPDEIAFPSWSKTLTVASVPTFWAVTTTSSSTASASPGKYDGSLAIEREQHALEVARVGDEDVAARWATAGAGPFVPGARDRIERIGVDHVATRSVNDQPSSGIGVGSDHREAAARRPCDGVGADRVFRRSSRRRGRRRSLRWPTRRPRSSRRPHCRAQIGCRCRCERVRHLDSSSTITRPVRSSTSTIRFHSAPTVPDGVVAIGAVGQIGDHDCSRGDDCHDPADHDRTPEPVVRP